MKIVHVSYNYDGSVETEEQLLEQHYTITGWAEALQRHGAEVTVMNRFHKDGSLLKNGVKYYFARDGLPSILKTRHLPLRFLRGIARLDADIVHLHNLTLSVQTFLLRRMLKKKTAIIIQHHGGGAPGRTKRFFYNVLNKVADAFFFTTVEQGKEWFMNKINADKILPVMEGATFFDYTDRDAKKILVYNDRSKAKEKTGMIGSPVFLWVGRLDDNKDPLTVLNGFDILLKKYPEAILYMIYSDDRSFGKVKERIDSSPVLKKNVYLIGKIDHDEIEQYYNSADYFVLGSHYEGSGYALSEALLCGCVPVITNIPSFRMMTDNGQLGALWEPGDADSFVQAAIAAINKPLLNEANACIDFYRENLSFDAIAKIAIGHYEKVMAKC